MSLADDIITVLTNYHGGYRLMRRRLMGLTDWKPLARHSDATIRTTLSRLKRAGFVHHDGGIWTATKKGLEKLSLKKPVHTKQKTKTPVREKSLIIAFDIPERQRAKRDWLRIELANLSFIKLQQSVRLGPAPLPKDFVEALEAFQLLRYLKFFEARETEIV